MKQEVIRIKISSNPEKDFIKTFKKMKKQAEKFKRMEEDRNRIILDYLETETKRRDEIIKISQTNISNAGKFYKEILQLQKGIEGELERLKRPVQK